jgi:hypothetical protein
MISRGTFFLTFFIYKNTLATFIARVFLKENSVKNYAWRSYERKPVGSVMDKRACPRLSPY